MQIHPLVTVKKASAVLGIDRNTLRERLGSGQMKGEKRRVGEKEKWFVYHEEIENWLEKQRLPELTEQAERLSTEGLSEIFDEPSARDEEKPIEGTVYITESMHREDLLLAQIVDQFASRLAQEQSKQINLEIALQAQTRLEKQVKELSNKLAMAELLRKGQSLEVASLSAKLDATQVALEKAEQPLWRRLFA